MPGRIERRAGVVPARETEAGQHAQGLLPYGLDSLDDRARIGRGVLERALEVVDDRQPLPGDLGAAVSLGALHLDGTTLAQIVQVSQGAQLLVFGFGEPSLQTRKLGVQIGDTGLQVGYGGAAAWVACAAAAVGPSGTVRAGIGRAAAGRAGPGTGVMPGLGRLAAASPGLPPAGRVTHWG